jgi:hypothetical protein
MATQLEIKLYEALAEAEAHLNYCGYGDKWEREAAKESKLAEKIESALEAAKVAGLGGE